MGEVGSWVAAIHLTPSQRHWSRSAFAIVTRERTIDDTVDFVVLKRRGPRDFDSYEEVSNK